MALSCLAGTNPLPVAARTSCTVSGSASSGRKQETEPMMLESSPQQPQRDDLNSSANASMISSGAPSPSVDGVRSASSLSAPSPNGASGGIPLNLFQQQQQQQQQQQAAMAAAFRAASLANYPGVVGQLPPHLPSLMASLQAVAGVPFHPHSRASAGLAGLLPNLPFNFPSMAQHQSALLNWSKLAQSAAAAALGVDGLGSILQQQQQHHHHHHHQAAQQQQHQQLSPDSSSHARKPNSNNNNKNVNYTGGLIVSGVADKVIKSAKTRTVKSAVARRNAKNALSRLDLLDADSAMKQELIIAEPPLVSPVGTTTSSSPPSVTGSSGGSSGGKRSTNAGEGPRDKVFSCSICHRTFGYKHVLQNHERTHTGEKPFECKQCGKRFTRDHHLKTHMRLHTGEKPYNCTHCDRQFVQVANLRRHLRVHTGERPYACELCTSRFSDSNQLKAHMLIHKGEKPFQCQLCSGRFRRRHHLMHHKCPKDPGAVLGKMTKIIGLNSKDAVEEAELTESEPPPTPSSYASPPEDEEIEDEDLALIKQQQREREQQQQQMILKSQQQQQQQQQQRGSRKPRETRRVIRPADLTGSTDLSLTMNAALASQPEQTEPEDLSTSSRMRHPSAFSVGSTGGWSAAGSVSIDLNSDHDDVDDVDDIDDELMLADEELEEDDDDDADLSDTVHMIRKKRREHALDLVRARKAKV